MLCAAFTVARPAFPLSGVSPHLEGFEALNRSFPMGCTVSDTACLSEKEAAVKMTFFPLECVTSLTGMLAALPNVPKQSNLHIAVHGKQGIVLGLWFSVLFLCIQRKWFYILFCLSLCSVPQTAQEASQDCMEQLMFALQLYCEYVLSIFGNWNR